MCPSESDLIRLLGGETTAQRRSEIQAHLETCQPCRRLYRELQLTWDALGVLSPPAAPDLTASILAAARHRRAFGGSWAAAAVLALAAGAGVVAGLATAPAPTVRVSADEVIQAIGLDALADGPSAFATLFVPESQDSTEEAPS
jgi:ferric-dicitrate binding protein FerR (iron transport regulator)